MNTSARALRWSSLLLVAVALRAPHIPSASADEAPKELWVELQDARLRNKPLHWASAAAPLSYGDKIEVLGTEGAWYRAAFTGADGKRVEGYVHQTAVTPKQVVLKGRTADVQIEADESSIVLAGKGFNREIEETYLGSAEEALDYAAVDCIEGKPRCTGKPRPVVSDEQLAAFVREGGLGGGDIR
jgi:hypothetical protein